MRTNTFEMVHRMSEVAVGASELLVPKPIRVAVDRTLVDTACVTRGGVGAVADRLQVDVPAVDAWRSLGVPTEFRLRVAALAIIPDLRRAA